MANHHLIQKKNSIFFSLPRRTKEKTREKVHKQTERNKKNGKEGTVLVCLSSTKEKAEIFPGTSLRKLTKEHSIL